MTVRQLPSKSWRAEAYLGLDRDGKTIRKSFTHPDKKTAVAMAAAYEAQHKDLVDRMALSEACRRYIAARRPFIASSTLLDYNSRLRTLCGSYPSLMAKHIHSVTEGDLRDMIVDMQKIHDPHHRFNTSPKSLSPKTIKNYMTFLSGVFKHEKIPFPAPEMPKKEPFEIYVPTDAEVHQLLEAAEGSELYVPVLLGAFAPLRRGEICALKYPRDFSGNVIHVREAIGKNEKGKTYRKEPKTPESNRYIEMPPEVIKVIKDQGYVTKLSPVQITRSFDRLLKKAGLPHFRFHDLRHYCISTLHAQGVPDAYIIKRSGHSTDAILKRVYRHTLADREAALAEKAVSHFQAVLRG